MSDLLCKWVKMGIWHNTRHLVCLWVIESKYNYENDVICYVKDFWKVLWVNESWKSAFGIRASIFLFRNFCSGYMTIRIF